MFNIMTDFTWDSRTVNCRISRWFCLAKEAVLFSSLILAPLSQGKHYFERDWVELFVMEMYTASKTLLSILFSADNHWFQLTAHYWHAIRYIPTFKAILSHQSVFLTGRHRHKWLGVSFAVCPLPKYLCILTKIINKYNFPV